MIRYLLIQGRQGTVVMTEDEYNKAQNFRAWTNYRGMTKKEAMEGMGALGLQYRCSRVGSYSTEYYDVTEEQSVLVKLFMQ